MHVLYFHQHFTTPRGSGGTRSYAFARALVAHGHRVTMVCGQNPGSGLDLPADPRTGWRTGKVEGIDVIALPLAYSNHDSLARRTWLFLRFAGRGVRIALRRDYDLLFASSTPLTAAIPGIVTKALGRRTPFVLEVRDLWPDLPRALGLKNPVLLGGMRILEWLAYRTADACIGLAPGIVDGIRRRAPAGCRVELIPNGCDLDIFTPGERGATGLPGIGSADFVAGFSGAHGPANGLDAVLDAAAELKRRGRRDIRLVLIGDGREKPRLVERARQAALDNCVFLPSVPKEELAAMTVRFDCGLMILADVPAFYYGTSPNKFFDYVSAGLPVVVNHPGWLADLVTENRCGLVAKPGSAADLADALCALADDPAGRQQMGRRARELAGREFDRGRLAGEFVRLLEGWGSEKPAPTRKPAAAAADCVRPGDP